MSTMTVWRRGAIGALTVGVVSAGTFALAPVAMAAPITTNVHGGDIAGWDTSATPLPAVPSGWFKQSDNQAGQATGAVVADDTEPANHDGSLHLATPAALDKVVVQHAAGTALLSEFVTGSYAAKVIAGGTRANYQLVIDCNGATAGGFATLNYGDGIDSQTPTEGWKTLDVVNGGNAMWWSTRTLNGDGTTASTSTAPTPGANGAGLAGGPTAAHQLSEFKSTCASGTVGSYGVNMGSGSAGLDGSVDSVTFNDAVTNFQRVSAERISGLNRVETAVAVSGALFDNAGTPNGASAVVLANSTGFADGVSGGPLAAAVDGPLLLTKTAVLETKTANEIKRVLPKGGTVHVLGGVGALSADVATSLVTLGFKVDRLEGANRFGTAVAVAERLSPNNTVFLTNGAGINYVDALSAGPAAAHTSGAVLLTNGATLPKETRDFLSSHPGVEVFAVGGSAAKAAPSTPADHQIVGADRYETGTKVASRFFTNPDLITFVTGLDFPDALSGGAFAGLLDSPIVLVRTDSVPDAVTAYLKANEKLVSGSAVVGGPGVVTEKARIALEGTLNGF